MYPYNYIIPNNTNTMYRNSQGYSQDDRFFLAPFLVGGLAGTALGYGIANNNQMNNGQCCCGNCFYPYPMPTPVYQVPYSQSTYSSQYTNYPNTFSNFGNNNFY